MPAQCCGIGRAIFDRRSLPSVFVSLALTRWFCLPSLSRYRRLVGDAWMFGVSSVRSPNSGHGGNNFSGYPKATDDVVSCRLVCDVSEKWHECDELAMGVVAGIPFDGLDLVVQTSKSNGSTRQGSSARNG